MCTEPFELKNAPRMLSQGWAFTGRRRGFQADVVGYPIPGVRVVKAPLGAWLAFKGPRLAKAWSRPQIADHFPYERNDLPGATQPYSR